MGNKRKTNFNSLVNPWSIKTKYDQMISHNFNTTSDQVEKGRKSENKTGNSNGDYWTSESPFFRNSRMHTTYDTHF